MSDLQDVIATSAIHAFNNGVNHGKSEGHNQLYHALMEGIAALRAEGTQAVTVDYMEQFINHGGYFEDED